MNNDRSNNRFNPVAGFPDDFVAPMGGMGLRGGYSHPPMRGSNGSYRGVVPPNRGGYSSRGNSNTTGGYYGAGGYPSYGGAGGPYQAYEGY